MKKICFVVNQYDPVIGGTEFLCKQILEHLLDKNKDYELSVITNYNTAREKNNYIYNIFDTSYETFPLMKDHFEIFNYDLTIFFADLHTPFLNSYDYKWSKKNICILNIDERTYELRNNFTKAIDNLKNFDCVITFTKNGICNRFLEENKINNKYIPNFSRDVLETKLESNLIEKLKLEKNNKTIFYNAAFEDRKNQKTILECIAKSEKLQNYNWIFIGSINNEKYTTSCISIIENNNLKNIRILKPTTNLKLIDQLYQVSDLVLLASIAEGMPLVLLEALSANKPIVSTDVGGVKGVLHPLLKLECLTRKFDVNELHSLISISLKHNRDYRKVWLNNFNKTKVCDIYSETIKELI